VLKFAVALQWGDFIDLGGEVNLLFEGLGCERLPSIDLARYDLAGCHERPEQHGSGVG